MRRVNLRRGLLLSTFLLGFAPPAHAQGIVTVTSSEVSYTFGEQITFEAAFESSAPIQQVQVVFRPVGVSNTVVNIATLESENRVHLDYALEGNLSIQAFSSVPYWYVVTLQSGEQVTTPEQSFYYSDNRFEWQSLEEDSYSLHWYNGDLAFAQAALDAARNGAQRTEQLLGLTHPPHVDIYIYAASSNMQAALSRSAPGWAGGHAAPQTSVILVSIPPGPEQSIEMERQIPHELAHLMLYQTLGAGYDRLPVWLNEGIASMMELFPNPDHAQELQGAVSANSLILLTDLCAAFPQDAAGAALAYAEADSFVRYLYAAYGTAGMQALLDGYASGQTCEAGAQAALGRPLAQMEREWRSTVLGENVALSAFSAALPWLVLLLLPLAVPFILTLSNRRKARAP